MHLVRERRLNAVTFMIMLQTDDFWYLDYQGDNVLGHAVDGGNQEAVTVLCDIVRKKSSHFYYRTLWDSTNDDGSNALTYAVHNKDQAMLSLLFFKGCRFLLKPANAINLLHQAGGWAKDFAIFEILIHELLNRDRYGSYFVEHYVNKATTFCDDHGAMHNLWDYLFEDDDLKCVALAISLVRTRDLDEPRVLFSQSKAGLLHNLYVAHDELDEKLGPN
jgi:hypothetical protein